jgi:hypothetical protein
MEKAEFDKGKPTVQNSMGCYGRLNVENSIERRHDFFEEKYELNSFPAIVFRAEFL